MKMITAPDLQTCLQALSPLDGRYARQTAALRPFFSEYALMRNRVMIEIEWLIFLSDMPAVVELMPFTQEKRQFLVDIYTHFSEEDALRIKALEAESNHDVKAIEYFLREKCVDLPQSLPFIHFACTSEDINNLAYALMFQGAKKQIILPLLQELLQQLRNAAENWAQQPLLARTHGQTATPTTFGKEMAVFVFRIEKAKLAFEQTAVLGKMNGAVGNFNAHCVAYPEINWFASTQCFVEKLGLVYNPFTTQIESHDYLSEHFSHLARLNQILVDFSRDIWGYIALDYFRQTVKTTETGSSTMPHKVNPIDFENAEGNLLLAAQQALFLGQQLLTSRWQRDLVDSTLLRNLGMVFGYSVVAYRSLLKGIPKLRVNEDTLQRVFAQHWEVLTEAVQTVMRRYGIVDAYEKLKILSRGKTIDAKSLHAFIENLAIPSAAKENLLALTPQTYLGLAADLALKC